MILTKLDVHRGKWGQMLNNMGCPPHLFDDMIHDAYLKMYNRDDHEKIIREDGDVNIFYFYLVLRSVYVDYIKSNPYDACGLLVPEQQFEELDLVEEYKLMDLYYDMLAEMDTFGRYGSKLSRVYFPTDWSLRALAKDTGISVTSIYNSVKTYKQHLKDVFQEQYDDYKNHKKNS